MSENMLFNKPLDLRNPSEVCRFVRDMPVGHYLGVIENNIAEIFRHLNECITVIVYVDGDVNIRRDFDESGNQIAVSESITNHLDCLPFGVAAKYDAEGINASENMESLLETNLDFIDDEMTD